MQHAEVTVNRLISVAASAARRHLVALHQEVPHAIVHVRIDRPIRRHPGKVVAEGGTGLQLAPLDLAVALVEQLGSIKDRTGGESSPSGAPVVSFSKYSAMSSRNCAWLALTVKK